MTATRTTFHTIYAHNDQVDVFQYHNIGCNSRGRANVFIEAGRLHSAVTGKVVYPGRHP